MTKSPINNADITPKPATNAASSQAHNETQTSLLATNPHATTDGTTPIEASQLKKTKKEKLINIGNKLSRLLNFRIDFITKNEDETTKREIKIKELNVNLQKINVLLGKLKNSDKFKKNDLSINNLLESWRKYLDDLYQTQHEELKSLKNEVINNISTASLSRPQTTALITQLRNTLLTLDKNISILNNISLPQSNSIDKHASAGTPSASAFPIQTPVSTSTLTTASKSAAGTWYKPGTSFTLETGNMLYTLN